jgi:hypothetical protein
MKKSLLIGLFGVAAVAAFGQGVITFGNYYSSTQTTGVYWGNGPDAGNYVGNDQGVSFILLYGSSTDTTIAQLNGSYTTSINVEGPYVPGSGPGAASQSNEGQWHPVAIPASVLASSTTYAFAYEATAVLGGNTYIGYSTIWTQTTSANNLDFGSSHIDTGSVALSEVVPAPEPSSLALAGLGG